MFCPNKVSDNALHAMQIDIIEKRQQIQHLKQEYAGECKTVKEQQKQIISMQHENLYFRQELQRLNKKLAFLEYSDCKRKPRLKKKWDKINSERTKRLRFASFKDLLLTTLKSMQVCHRAEISLWFEQNKINFSFSPSDLNGKSDKRNCLNDQFKHVKIDHAYASDSTQEVENECFNDLDYCEIYDNNGEWKKQHIRRIIYVLDAFRISHEAYHELRIVSKGHLPPIGRLSKEKKIMSEEIPYEKHPKVSTSL